MMSYTTERSGLSRAALGQVTPRFPKRSHWLPLFHKSRENVGVWRRVPRLFVHISTITTKNLKKPVSTQEYMRTWLVRESPASVESKVPSELLKQGRQKKHPDLDLFLCKVICVGELKSYSPIFGKILSCTNIYPIIRKPLHPSCF